MNHESVEETPVPGFPTMSWMEMSKLLDKVGQRLKKSREKLECIVIERDHLRSGESPDAVYVYCHMRYRDYTTLKATLIPEGQNGGSFS